MFQAADSENLGVVTGELAVKLFERSGLGPRLLGEVCVSGAMGKRRRRRRRREDNRG